MYQDEWRSVTTIHDLLFRDFFLCRRVGDPFSPAGLPVRSVSLSLPPSPLFSHSLSLALELLNTHEREETKRERTRMAGQDDPGGKAVIAKKDNARED